MYKKNLNTFLASLLCLCINITSICQSVVINEVITDPQQDWSSTGFTSAPGGSAGTNDEWLELFIKKDGLDLTGWTIELNDTSPVIGNLTSTGAFDVSNYISSGSGIFTNTEAGDYLVLGNVDGSGAMNNSITIILKDSGGTVIDSVTLGGDVGEAPSGNASSIANESVIRTLNGYDTNIDNSDFTQSTSSIGTSNSNTINWIGKTNNDWNTSSNWEGNVVPGMTSDVFIVNGLTNYPTTSTAVTVNSIILGSGATLIANSTFAGNITYNRTLTTDNWYLISSPVSGQDIDAFVSAEGLATGSGNNLGFAPYLNDGTAWSYYQSGASDTGDFVEAKGYSIKLAAAGDISFTGTMFTENQTIEITDGSANEFNLVGNPFPSYIAVNDNANGTNNILRINDTDNDFLSESTLWFWDQSANGGIGGYEQINQASAAFHIAPGQGFFVNVNTTGAPHNLQINENMQSHQSSDSFYRNTFTRPEVQLLMTNGSITRDADIYYIDGTTTGFDNGYDSSIFGGVSNSFAVYTEAVANSQGRKLGIQSLPNTGLENMIIPVGVNSDAQTVTLSVKASNLPSRYKVFLEDKQTANFIRLDKEGSKYEVTFNETVNGIGRFFLHTTTNALSTGSFDTNNVSAFISQKHNLKVLGIQLGTTSVRMFNILGKQVLDYSFKANGANDVPLPYLKQGVYIVQIASEHGTLNKKIVIE